MNKIILTVGAAGAGKTTWAEAYLSSTFCRNINRDDVRFNGKAKDWTKYKFTKSNEKRVSIECYNSALNAVECDASIIISDTNLNPKTRVQWKKFADVHGYEYDEIAFECSWDELRKRNSQREGGVAETVLWDQYLRMNEYLDKTVHEHCDNPKAIIIDVDGTIARMGGRGPFDWHKVKDDVPRNFVIGMIKGAIAQTGAKPVFLSGRDGICMQDTRDWISKNFQQENIELYMRGEGDFRKDVIIKREIFMESIDEKYDVIGAFDDRACILRLWKELDIPNIIDVSGDRHNEF
jgi:predicted kinase